MTFKDYLAIGCIARQENYVLIDPEDFAKIKLIQCEGQFRDDMDITRYNLDNKAIEDLIERNNILNKLKPHEKYSFKP